jgi:hypothetical protein
MQDYFIFIAALQALDNESKNIYYACYDIADHPRLTMVPWDLDICLGQNYDPAVSHPDAVRPDRPLDWLYHLPMASIWHIPSIHNDIVDRYKELRKGVLSTENLVNRYRTLIDELENCGASAREERRWSRNRDLAGNKLDISAEMDYVEDWIRQRMPFLDEHVFVYMTDELRGDINLDGEVGIADLNLLINVILFGSTDNALLKRADVNGDGEINIGDVNALIDLILN